MPHYECPVCQRLFDHSNIRYLHGDHIWPYSIFGDTSWGNYRLICGSCNSIKSNLIDLEVRSVLGSGTFRVLVKNHLAKAMEEGKIQKHLILEEIIGS
ncbi:MAG: HNH endonuclease [Candidatus Obscuribacter sp.]|nr:HNH endonuclease [Candidatus Obscuribacter sp.]MBP7575704.1 HNH endonuclease [Candidatus Obscuribacter sp.]